MVSLNRRHALTFLSSSFLVGPAARLLAADGEDTIVFASAGHAHGVSVPSTARNVACCSPGNTRPLLYKRHEAVDAAFVARHPDVSFVSMEGEGYALSAGEITVEAFGAAGDGQTNDQPAIQKAIDFAAESGASTVRFGKSAYAVWMPKRRSDPAAKNTYDGHPIVVKRTVALVGRAVTRSSLNFRNVDGKELASAWQTVNGKVWRGSGIYLKGLGPADRGNTAPPSISLSDLNLDGGCDMGAVYSYPARMSDGDGWDLTHKGLWSEEDKQTGDWTVQRCKVSRFRGELIYQGGAFHGAITMRNVEFSETNADIINPCGTNLDIDGAFFHDGFSGWEGWGGRSGRIVNTLFQNCKRMGGIQGGRAYTATHERGAFAQPTPFKPGIKPWLTLDIKIINCGPVYLGSWVRGRIEMINSTLAINSSVFRSISDIDLVLIAQCRNKRLPAAVSVTGGAAGSKLLNNIAVDLRIIKPVRGGYLQPVLENGAVGNGVVISVRDATYRQQHG